MFHVIKGGIFVGNRVNEVQRQFFIREHWNDAVDERFLVERLEELRYMVTMFYSPELKIHCGVKQIEISDYPYKNEDVKACIFRIISKHGIKAALGDIYFREVCESLRTYAEERNDTMLIGVLKAFLLCNTGRLDVLIPSLGLCSYMSEHDFQVSA